MYGLCSYTSLVECVKKINLASSVRAFSCQLCVVLSGHAFN